MLLSQETDTELKPAKYKALSLAQERLWSHQILEPRTAIYNIPLSYTLKGNLDIEHLQESIKKVAARHETLRTGIIIKSDQPDAEIVDDQPVQAVYAEISVKLPVIDLQHLAGTELETKVQEISNEEASKPFDLNLAPLWRAKLLRLSPQFHIFLFNIHHIISDRWSVHIFMEELATFYEASLVGKTETSLPLPKQYSDFAEEQKEWLAKKQESQVNYWQQQLDGNIPPLELPIDKVRTPVIGYQGARQTFVVTAEVTSALKQLSDRFEATLYMTLLAAFETLLYQYTQQEDMIVCSPIAGRHRFQTKDAIGYFINLLPMRTNLSGDPSFQELLKRVSKFVIGTYKNLDLPFQAIAKFPNLVRTPLTRGFFALQPIAKPLAFSEVKVTYEDIATGTANFEVALFLEEKEGQLIGLLDYKTELFESSTILEMIENFKSLLVLMVENPAIRLSSLNHLREKKVEENNNKIETSYVAPQKEIEKTIAQIWQEVLKIDKVGVNQNFFDLGGQSLAVAQVISKLKEIFKKELLIVDLFRYPTISTIAQYLSQEKSDENQGFSEIKDNVQRRQEMFKRQKQMRQQRREPNGG